LRSIAAQAAGDGVVPAVDRKPQPDVGPSE
jgi:hypothetical protein